ncbi:MAG: hypothetical protein PHE94_06985 [Eubacteriales bacterium]|nr:hypothetical protein [Eubacteriales bacterium]
MFFLSIFSAELYILGAVFVLLLAFIFAGIAFSLFRVFYGEPQESQYIRRGETNKPGTAVLIVLMLIIAGTGLYMPGLLKDLITSAQMIIIGG